MFLGIETSDDDTDSNKTHVVFHKGKPQIVDATHQISGESPRLAQPYTFMILSLDTHLGQGGVFKMK